ncbi:hypothetical protein, partial [Bifidobacterium miconisargentati]|uniref:hypothetical protein n=1 Tax=Bifidobacterium miconisargentati TaxID=2834437 RepID=UPI001BDCA11A
RQYALGRRPVSIFRDAGLDPRLVGYKRIERAFARWKQAEHEPALPWERSADGTVAGVADGSGGGVPAGNARDRGPAGAGGVSSAGAASVAGRGVVDGPSAGAVRMGAVPSRAGRVADTRDVLITQQIHYIQYLERELDRMRRLLNDAQK